VAKSEERSFRFDEGGKQELQQFLNTKNLIKTVVKLLFGNNEESTATSRQVLNVFVKVLDMLRTSFGQRARSAESRGARHLVDDVASAGVSMLRGYVKSIMAESESCTQKYICEASSAAVREGRELGYLVAQVGGYASSYLLDNQKSIPFKSNYDAARQGRSGADCKRLYLGCNEAD